jgi:hypothetical protein
MRVRRVGRYSRLIAFWLPSDVSSPRSLERPHFTRLGLFLIQTRVLALLKEPAVH